MNTPAVEPPIRTRAAVPTDSVELQAVKAGSGAPASQPTPSNAVLRVLASVGLGPLVSNGPLSPVEPPGSWIVLAWARRQGQQTLTVVAPSIGVDPARTTLALDSGPAEGVYTAQADRQSFAMAATTIETNTPPEAWPTFSSPDLATGTITGAVNATDPDGDVLGYTVTGAPARGTIAGDPATGAFTYTPTDAARLEAAQTTQTDKDTFIVTVSDGEDATPIGVSVPVSPAALGVTVPTAVGTSPTGVVVSPDGSRTYVANQGSGTVSVIDTNTGAVVSTITVGASPTGVTVSPDGSKLYVTNRSSGTVSVISTSTNTVASTVMVASSPTGVAVSPDGSKVYVTNSGSRTVSVINSSTNTVVSTVTVGLSPGAIVVSPDGSKVYVANRTGGTVSVINTSTNAVGSTVRVGSSPAGLAVSPNGGRVYVTNSGSSSVSVINAAINTVASTVSVGASPNSVAVSPDGSLAYVANGKDTVSVIDTRTNTVVRTVTIDPVAETSTHYLAVSPDGNRIYVTDTYDRTVRVMSMTGIFENTAPQVAAPPTVGTPDLATGTVSGSVMYTDPDGDALSYSVNGAPAHGTVTVDAASGAYTYTPTEVAREQAYSTPGEDVDTFTVVAGDGQLTTAVTVAVAISPAPPPDLTYIVTPIPAGTSPTGVAVTGNQPYQAYVVNSYDGTVAVIDIANGHVTKTIPVGYYPTRVAASPDGEHVYVANYDTVSVIDTSTNAVTATIPVPSDGCGQGCYNGVWDVAVSPDGDVLYAAVGDGTVSKINTNTGDVISTKPVGFWDGDMELSPDGGRLYAADGITDTVVVYDTATMQPVGTVDVGPGQFDQARNVAIRGTRAYVTEEVRVVERASGGYSSGWFIIDAQGNTWVVTDTYSAVSVIDTDPTSATYNTTIATITVPDGALDVAISPDGHRAYVTHSDGRTVTVIDTATNSVVETLTTDQNATTGSQYITVGPDGRLYITDSADGTVYAVTVGDPIAL